MRPLFINLVLLLAVYTAMGQVVQADWHFDVTMAQPATHTYHVTFQCPSVSAPMVTLKMPVWTPGYYQLMNYAANVDHVQATDENGKMLSWEKTGSHSWVVQMGTAKKLVFGYDVKATRNFVASPYLDDSKGYISPAGLFVYFPGQLQHPVTVTVHPLPNWSDLVATGLDSVAGQRHTFMAPNFDVLYDSPMLMGKLEQLPAFTVGGIPHQFVGYNMGEFDRVQFMTDLKKIVTSSVAVIGDIPYKHYTFLAIGPGGGGIEHLNSASVSFNGSSLHNPVDRARMYNFLTHEYFHHYNVKRIRPIALGPFDYERENQTNMLWVSEGLTVYYEDLILRRAGLLSQADALSKWQARLTEFENKPGRLFQSATQASYDTWSDGPFGRQGDEAYKTISYYEKGPILGLLLDLSIRNATQNKRSLDDVMRTLYQTIYRRENRGFTDAEFQQICEKTAGTALADVFQYASTVKPIDYAKYLAYAGLSVTETSLTQPGAWLGISTRVTNDSVQISQVDWESPAWKAGLRTGDQLLQLDGKPIRADDSQVIAQRRNAGDSIQLLVQQNGRQITKTITLDTRTKRLIRLSPIPNATPLQTAIRTNWMRGN